MANELTPLIPILIEVAPELLIEIGKWGLDKLQETSPLAKAITATEMAFPEVENLRTTLNAWCKSNAFSGLLSNLEKGQRDLADDGIVDNFKASTDFYFGDTTDAVIKRIIATLFTNFQRELYATSEGLNFVANRQEVLFEETKTEIREGNSSIHSGLAEIKQLISRSYLLDDTEKRDEHEAVFHARVDAARTLLQEGKVKAALSLLKALRQEIKDKHPSKQLLFRIETNMGAGALELQELEDAKVHLRFALEFNPENPKALSNAAVAELIDKRLPDALKLIEKARSLKVRDSHATSIYIEILERMHRLVDLEELLTSEPWILDDLSCGIVLASVRLKQENFIEAHALVKKCIALDQDNPVSYLLFAESIIRPIQKTFQNQQPLRWRVKPETILSIREAEQALTRAIELLSDHDNSSKTIEAFANRAIVRGMLGQFQEAISDCDRVLNIDPNELTANHNKGLLLLDVGKHSDAIPYLEKSYAQDKESVGRALALASAYTDAAFHQKTVGILEPYWESESESDPKIKIIIADLLLTAYTELKQETKIASVFEVLRTKFPNNPLAISVLAHQKKREGKFDEAITLLSDALRYTEANHDLIKLQLAELYYAKREFSKAAEYYEQIVNQESNSPQLQKYLISLFNAGSLKEALALSQRLRADGDAIPMISEIEARIHAYVGAYDEARKLYSQLSRIEPDKTNHLIEIAVLDILKGTPQNCVAIVHSITIDKIKDDPYALMKVAQIRSELGLPDVLPFAYRARRLAYKDPKIHLTYIGLFLKSEKKGHQIPDPTRVAIDSTVHIKDETETKIFTIIDDDIVSIERGEIPPSDTLAKTLLGKSKGETIVLREGIEDLSYLIVEVQSKFVRAFQQTLAEFTTLFPDNKHFYKVKVKDNDFSKVFSMLDRRHEWVAQAMQLYDSKQLTLGAFSEIVGRGLITVWEGMVARADGKIFAANSTTEEMSKEGMLLSNCDSIAIELTSLLTLNSLNLLDRLSKRFSKVFVSQSVVDELNNALRETNEIQPSLTVWKEKDQYWRKEADSASIAREQEFLRTILEYVESSSEIVPTTKALEMGKDKFEETAKLIGKSSLCSILTAKECNTLLYSDQLGLRQIAKSEWGVDGVWSQSVLVSMRDQSFVSPDEYADAIKKLALANYFFVSINAQTLISILKGNGMALTQEVVELFKLFHGPTCSEESCLTVLGDMVKLLWLEPIPHQNKLLILDLVLSSLVTGRVAQKVIPRFKAVLHDRFFLMPQQLGTILQAIALR